MALAAAMAPKVVRVVDERWEEVERADDGQVVAQSVDGGVVGCVEADEKALGVASAPWPSAAP
jgi:hypothetical protein